MAEKTCTKCGRPGPFHKAKGRKDGLSPWCSNCKNAADKSYRDRHPRPLRPGSQADKLRPKVCTKCGSSGPFKKGKGHQGLKSWCNACENQYNKAYYLDRAKDPTIRAQNVRKAAEWRKRNPGSRRDEVRARRARLAGVKTDLTKKEWAEILEHFGHACAYCLRTGVKLTQDHVIAISNHGDHTADNVVPACGPCNFSKQHRPLWVMLERCV